MVPLKLQVKNFMCYRDNAPLLDLEGMHVACLSGENGHGKTALLDAISWALWGAARARTQEELVHQGQQNMEVELEFAARRQRYLVNRKYTRSARSRQGTTSLELQVASADGFRPITGGVMRETQRKIDDILNMDYDTFISTAFLRQGDADRFTKSRPSERKATLAEVLDLSYYARLEELSRDRSRDIQQKSTRLSDAIADAQGRMTHRAEYEAELSEVAGNLGEISSEVQQLWLDISELRRRVDALRMRRGDVAGLQSRIDGGQKEISLLKAQVRGHESRVAGFQEALDREGDIREQYGALEEARERLQSFNQALAESREFERGRADAEREVAVERERLSGRAASLRRTLLESLRPRAARLPEIEAGLAQLTGERASLDKLDESVRRGAQEHQELDAQSRDLEAHNARLLEEMEETRRKFDMLDLEDAVCPLCRTPLGPDGQAHLRGEYKTLGREAKRGHTRNIQALESLRPRIEEHSVNLRRLEKERDQGRRRIEVRTANLERDRTESLDAEAELQSSEAELQRLERILENEEFAREHRVVLSDLDARISALGYDAGVHRLTQQREEALRPYADLHRKLEEAAQGLPAEREALETDRQILGRRLQEVRDALQRKSQLEEELKALPDLESRLRESEDRHSALATRRDRSLIRQGVLQHQIADCDELQARAAQQRGELDGLADERSVYDQLAAAFGKNGIQALLIESAIPQIQNDSNELLARLTENRMSLKLQLQEGRKDRQTGLPSEELDIKIADDVGTRSYETFSGGESFRIDFALRIALSKLLARRSGAPLPTLFIDEGFGSQDGAGQERLTEAIQSIQDDFEKIIVITHIEQMKQAFPVRIDVTKTAAGSTFEVV